ncbi:MAG: [FeFe] hydrogenase, group A [Candidatus Kuenenbacteria bacterium]
MNFNIYINNKKYSANQGQTILDIAKKNNLFIPALCKHPDLKIQGKCRICLVEVEGMGIVTSCSTLAEKSMKIKLNTPDVLRTRKINFEMIFAQHIEKCDSCIQEYSCRLKKASKKYKARLTRFEDRKKDYPIWNFGALGESQAKKKKQEISQKVEGKDIDLRKKQARQHAAGFIQLDASKCIDCGICTEVCKEKQTVDFYETRGKGYLIQTKPTDNQKKDCTYCGQCIVHCPVGAIQGVPHWQNVEELLKNKKKHKKILVAQIAPSIRVSIGEEFDMDYGRVVTGQLAASMKKVGFDYAFDVSTGADFTTYEEARELVHWLESDRDRPMFTSCCPAWVKFVEFYYPDFVPHLTTTRSPHIISGQITKTYFADLIDKDPQDIIVVSIMPCTAKKQEISLERHTLNRDLCIKRLGLEDYEIETKCFVKNNENKNDFYLPAVDYVLTTREFAYLLKRNKINLAKIKPQEMDSPLGEPSGAGVIYGASGGVMESALRTADVFLQVKKKFGNLEPILLGEKFEANKKKLSHISNKRINFKSVRGQAGFKEAAVQVGNIKLKVAVVSGLGNARKLLDNISSNKVKYDYVEVMACDGGCIGGGGQPVPISADIRQKRANALYAIDQSKKIRTAHDNSSMLKVYRDYFQGDEKIIEELMHCEYDDIGRGGYKQISNF